MEKSAPFKIISFLCTCTHTLVYLESCLHSAGYASLCIAVTALSLQSACSVLECNTWYRSILALCNLGPVAEGRQYCRRELLLVDAQFRAISADWRPFSTGETQEEYGTITFLESCMAFFYTHWLTLRLPPLFCPPLVITCMPLGRNTVT